MVDVIEVQQNTTTVEVTQTPPPTISVTQASPLTIEVATGGIQGAVGPTPNLQIGTTTTGAAGSAAAATITGTLVNPLLNLTIPRGNTGATGPTGPTGPANVLMVAAVNQLSPVSTPTVTIAGTSPSQNLTFGIPAGAKILNGTAAPATGTGLQGDWYLNTVTDDLYEKTSSTVWTLRTNIKGLKGDTGNTGATGPANQLTVGTVSASAPGSAPTVTIGGTAPSQTISFVLPTGATGPTGPAPNLTIGTVTTVAPGGTATATVTGTNPNYSVNFGIPRGDKGDIGAQWLTGTSAPTSGTGVIGDFYLVTGATGTGDVYKKTDATTWTLQGNIRGAAGSGNVDSVNSVLPDANGNVLLTWSNFTGTIPASALPSIATTETYTVASEAAMLALTAQRGDLAIRTDLDETYILAGDDPTVLANWTQLLTDGGNVRLTGDQTIGGIKTFSVAPVVPDGSWTIAKTTGLQTAINGKEPTITAGTTAQYWRGDKSWQTLDKTAVGLSNVVNLAQVDLVNAQTIAGIKTFSSAPVVPANSWTIANTNGLQGALDGKANTAHTHDAADVITGTFAIARIPTGTTGTTVALGNHLHTGVYEPVIAAGTTSQYRRGDNTWATLDKAAVGLSNVANSDTTNAANIISGTLPDARFPGRLQAAAANITDWNLANETGFWRNATANALNAPDANYYSGYVVKTASRIFQTVWEATSASADTKTWQRQYDGTAWGAWYRLRESEAELDARYQALITAGTTAQYYRGDKTWATLDKTAVGLSLINNVAQVEIAGAQTITGAKTFSALITGTAGVTTGGVLTVPGTSYQTFGATGSAAPAFTTKSAGTKAVLWDVLSTTQADYAIGIEPSNMWYSVPSNLAGNGFKWYGGTTLVASLTGTGDLSATGTITAGGAGFIGPAAGLTGLTAGNLTGTVPIGVIPTGTTGTTVALGNHGHALTDANISGILPIAQVPTGTTGTTVALGNHTHALSAITSVFDATIPSALGTAAVGTAATAARRDHVHAMPTAAQVGAATTVHTHTLLDLPGAWVKMTVRVATTANITLSAPQTIDGVAVVAGDRVLVKNQTTAAQNGIYTVAAAAWTRSTDTDISTDAAGATVSIDQGTQGGQVWSTTFKTTDTLGTSAMNWYKVVDTSQVGVTGGVESFIVAGTTAQYRRGDKTWQTLNSAAVGLGSVANTAQVDLVNAQTIGGAKTFSAALTASSTLTVTGQGNINGGLNTPWMEIGSTTGASTPFIDFHAGATATDYDARIIALTGTGVTGKGTLRIEGVVQINDAIYERAVNASGTTGTVTLDASIAGVFYVSPTGNITTLSITNVPSGTSTAVTVTLLVDGTAGTPSTATIAGPAGAIWMATNPTPVSGKARVYTFMSTNGGSSWYSSGAVQV